MSEELKKDDMIFGLALCCDDKPPEWKEKHEIEEGGYRMFLDAFVCEKCGEYGTAWGGGKNAAAKAWNEKKNYKVNGVEPKINAPEGWRWASSLQIEYLYMGGKHYLSHVFALFKTQHPHILKNKDGNKHLIDSSRILSDIEIKLLSGESLPWSEKLQTHISLSHNISSEKKRNYSEYCIYATTTNKKAFEMVLQALKGVNLLEYEMQLSENYWRR